MMTNLTYEEFVDLYYGYARERAEINLAGFRKNSDGFDKNIDLDYIVSAAVLTTLRKVYEKYDASRGASIKTFISDIVHNEVVDELERETKGASKKADLDDLKKAIRDLGQDDSREARLSLVPKMMAVISKLPPDDQVILNFYLEDKSSYIEKSAEMLNISKNYVSVRRDRIFARMRDLMNMTKAQYGDYLANYAPAGQFTTSFLIRGRERREAPAMRFVEQRNYIMPSLNISDLAEKLVDQLL